jgi:hypothetical protein
VGARSVAHVEDNLRAADLAVPADVLERLEAVSAIELGWPQDFLREGGPGWFAHAERLGPRAA